MKITVFNQKKRIMTIMLTAVLLCSLSVPALAEEQEVKTYEKAGVRVAVPAEFKDPKGVLDWGIFSVYKYYPPIYTLLYTYTAMSQEDYNDYNKKVENDEVSSEEYLEFSNSTVADLGMFYAVKGDLTDLPDITKDGEVIELGSVDGYNSYYVKQFDADAHSNWDEEFLEEAEMLSEKIVEMLKQAEYFKPIDPAAELIGKKLTFKAEDLDHNWHTSEELFSQNRFTLVNVWGTWCGPCKSELEDLGEFHRKIEDKNCGVLGLEHEFKKYEKFAQEAKDILKEKNVTYPNVLVNDDMDSIKAFSSHPSFFFVNSEGVVVSPTFTGAVSVFDTFMPELDKLLAEPISEANVEKEETTLGALPNGTATSEAEAEEAGSYRYRVFVKDEEGNPVEEVAVQFCDETACRMGETDELGCAAFEVSQEKSYEIHIPEMPDGFEDVEETFKTDLKASDTTIVLKKAE